MAEAMADQAVLQVECPTCGRQPGEQCVTAGGKVRAPHASRFRVDPRPQLDDPHVMALNDPPNLGEGGKLKNAPVKDVPYTEGEMSVIDSLTAIQMNWYRANITRRMSGFGMQSAKGQGKRPAQVNRRRAKNRVAKQSRKKNR